MNMTMAMLSSASPGFLRQGLLYGCPAMLSVVDDEGRRHRNRESANPFLGSAPARMRLESDFGVHRGRQCRKGVGSRVIDDVARHLRDARLVQGALSAHLRRKLVLVEQEDPRDQPQWAHGDVVLVPSLHPRGSPGIRTQSPRTLPWEPDSPDSPQRYVPCHQPLATRTVYGWELANNTPA